MLCGASHWIAAAAKSSLFIAAKLITNCRFFFKGHAVIDRLLRFNRISPAGKQHAAARSLVACVGVHRLLPLCFLTPIQWGKYLWPSLE